MDSEIEEEDMGIPDMELEGNVEIPGVDMKGQEAPTQVVEIDNPDIPQATSIIALEVPSDPDGPTQVSTLTTEGPCRSTRVRSQPYTYAPIMTGKKYEYAMT